MFTLLFLILCISLTNDSVCSPEILLKSLSLRQKIGQFFVVAATSNVDQPTEQLASLLAESPYNVDPAYVESLIREYGVGGVTFLYKSDPVTQMALTKKLQCASRIPLLITQDCEWGLSMRLDSDPQKVVRYPRNMTLGAIQDEQIIYDIAYEIGKQCAAIGVHMNFAPVVDVNNNPANPVIHDRSFGDDPKRVAHLAKIFAKGLHDAGVLACAKHFPGHGDTHSDSHLELPVINHDYERLNEIELVPFKALIKDGIDAIMHGHLSIPTLDATKIPSSLSYAIVTQLLQKTLRYQGLNITDGLGMKAVMARYAPGELELAAFLAGNDILLCPLDVPTAITNIENTVLSGLVSEAELDRRVLKILRAKEWVFEQQKKINHRSITEIESCLVRKEAYFLQEKAYRAAITVVPQHQEKMFNLHTFDKSGMIIIGKLEENCLVNICALSGKETLSYRSAFDSKDLEICIGKAQKYDIVIIALGEMNKFMSKSYGIAKNVLTLVERLHALKKTVVVVLFGTPYSVPLFPLASSCIVAYEDIAVAQKAVVDVLKGVCAPVGVLPVKL